MTWDYLKCFMKTFLGNKLYLKFFISLSDFISFLCCEVLLQNVLISRYVAQSLQRLTNEAIRGMKVRRYNESRKHNDSDRDTCAVCLDAFCNNQVKY